MVSMKAAELFAAAPALGELMQKAVTPKLSLHLRRMARAVDQATKDLAEVEKAILREAGAEEDEAGGFRTVGEGDAARYVFADDAAAEAAGEKRRAMYEEEVEVDVRPLKASLLDAADLPISGHQAYALGPLLEDDLED